jgi:antitoxin PrlF
MAISTVTSKGQVTIPKKIREKLNLRSGDKLDFRIEDDDSVHIYALARSVEDVFGMFAEKTAQPYSTKEAREIVREAFRKGSL